jgi:hypothetical protein
MNRNNCILAERYHRREESGAEEEEGGEKGEEGEEEEEGRGGLCSQPRL